jgi:hypothetical protein
MNKMQEKLSDTEYARLAEEEEACIKKPSSESWKQ